MPIFHGVKGSDRHGWAGDTDTKMQLTGKAIPPGVGHGPGNVGYQGASLGSSTESQGCFLGTSKTVVSLAEGMPTQT